MRGSLRCDGVRVVCSLLWFFGFVVSGDADGGTRFWVAFKVRLEMSEPMQPSWTSSA